MQGRVRLGGVWPHVPLEPHSYWLDERPPLYRDLANEMVLVEGRCAGRGEREELLPSNASAWPAAL